MGIFWECLPSLVIFLAYALNWKLIKIKYCFRHVCVCVCVCVCVRVCGYVGVWVCGCVGVGVSVCQCVGVWCVGVSGWVCWCGYLFMCVLICVYDVYRFYRYFWINHFVKLSKIFLINNVCLLPVSTSPPWWIF